MQQKKLGFTLVELVIVIVIIGILGTIGLLSYSAYTMGARDANRASNLSRIKDSLNIYGTKNKLPLPDFSVEVRVNNNVIGYQGYAGATVLEAIDYRVGGEDPKDNGYFSYYVTKDRTSFQLLGFFEEQNNLTSGIFSQANAASYSSRFPKVEGKNLGILTDSSFTPIQEISTVSSAGYLDIGVTSSSYIAHITDTQKIQGASSVLKTSAYNYDCKRLLEAGLNKGSGLYRINPTAGTSEIHVYCDMETDGGGWTSLVYINPRIQNSYYWNGHPNTTTNGFYNYIAYASTINPKEVYVSRNSVGWDGSEYVFELEGDAPNASIYTRRGTLSDTVIATGVSTLLGPAPELNNWLNAYAASKTISGTPYSNFALNDTSSTTYDFPFNNGTSPVAPNDDFFSNVPWGGRQFSQDIPVYIFVRE